MVIKALAGRDDHPTAEDVYSELRMQGESVSLATVYRTLRTLEEEDRATAIHGAGADRFDARIDPHYHLSCVCCGQVVDLSLPYQESLDEAARRAGVDVADHRLMFRGRCARCDASWED